MTFNCFYSEFITPEWLKNIIVKENKKYEDLDEEKNLIKLLVMSVNIMIV